MYVRNNVKNFFPPFISIIHFAPIHICWFFQQTLWLFLFQPVFIFNFSTSMLFAYGKWNSKFQIRIIISREKYKKFKLSCLTVVAPKLFMCKLLWNQGYNIKPLILAFYLIHVFILVLHFTQNTCRQIEERKDILFNHQFSYLNRNKIFFVSALDFTHTSFLK